MPEVIYYVASSVDGFLAPADGSLDWLAPFEGTGEDHGYEAFYAGVDAVLVGSRTYEQALGFPEWPWAGKPTWVFSHRELPTAAGDVTVTSASPADVLAELDAAGVRRAWLVGGGTLAGAFQRAGLIDEYIISIVPTALGTGIGLFGGAGELQELRLVDATPYPDGIVTCTYRTR